ncbi:MAG: peptidoglycan DD-metalloendopeptidase family protein [Candidatus Pacebacteria bacterium]|nr:peptidoglycan DD-metalloendopeptidase family protein [Candidatus Paceibacterota bacterium]
MLQDHFKLLILFFIIFSLGLLNPSFINASIIDDIKNQIQSKSSSIGDLEKEIKKYQEELNKVSEEKKSLNNEIYRLNLDRKKISTDINLTDNKIQSTSLTVQKLAVDIQEKENSIYQNNTALAEIVRLINENDSNSIVEILLSQKDLSEFWDDFDSLQRLQIDIKRKTSELVMLKNGLETVKMESEMKERELLNYKSQLADQKQIIDYNKKEKDQLLSVTANKESLYKKQLEEKKKLMEEVLQEIQRLESQLKIEIDPSSLPDANYGILSWPLENIYITQFFGNTPFSTSNPQVYNGNGHPGIDFRASSGTKVLSAMGGVVKGTGNTDSIPPKCYSYGKWVLIEHPNGLSTLYAHLSLIKVSAGQTVNAGEIIGYSGNTGYSTGPHLHFGVYASKGVQITKFTNSINCKDKYIPLASRDAYLNPMSYLPKY